VKVLLNTYLLGTKFNTGTNSVRNVLKTAPYPMDSVSFSGNTGNKENRTTREMIIDPDVAKTVANSLSTSTSGHRAKYNTTYFNKDTVRLTAAAAGQYALEKASEDGRDRAKILIVRDTRPESKEASDITIDTLMDMGNIDIIELDEATPTPAGAGYAQEMDVDLAFLYSPSHNNWGDAGSNFMTKDAAIAPAGVTSEIGKKMIKIAEEQQYEVNPNGASTKVIHSAYDVYKNKLESLGLIDYDTIANAGISIYYDGLKGTGENYVPVLLDDYGIEHTIINSGDKPGPNPIEDNLKELKSAVANDSNSSKIGLTTDGDADRFGFIDSDGAFISPNDVIKLIGYHLAENKGIKGDFIRSQGTTSSIDIIGEKYGVNTLQTPVGFKYIAEDIIDLRKEGKDILVAGEESGGLTVHGHIPEKDGIVALMIMLDLLAAEKLKAGRAVSLTEILENIDKDLGAVVKNVAVSQKLSDETGEKDKKAILERTELLLDDAAFGFHKNNYFPYEINVEKSADVAREMEEYRKGGDGVKLYFNDTSSRSSVLVRASGTEPKIKAYIEAIGSTKEEAEKTYKNLKAGVDKLFTV